jgi:hypothetical protein
VHGGLNLQLQPQQVRLALSQPSPSSHQPNVVVTLNYTFIYAVSHRANFPFDTFTCTLLHQLVGSHRFCYDIHIMCLVSSGPIISNIFSPHPIPKPFHSHPFFHSDPTGPAN